MPAYTSPLSSATYGADFSWLFGLVVGSVAYWILSAGAVRNELIETDSKASTPVA